MKQAMTVLQEVLFWLALASSLVAVASCWTPPFRSKSRSLLGLALGVLSAHVAVRWVVSGHPPLYGTFENSVAAAWTVLVAGLYARRWYVTQRLPADFERWFSALAPVFLIFGALAERTPVPTAAPLRSILLYAHVSFAWCAHTLLLAATVSAVLVLVRRGEWETPTVDSLMIRATGGGFALFTAMAVMGAVVSYSLFGSWYRWEIVEAFTLGAWLAYSSILHAAMLFQWRGRKLAWALVAALPLLLGTFWVWSVYSGTYHNFSIPTVR